MKLNIVFFGASKHVIPTINMLKDNYDLRLVVTTETKPADTIPTFCKTHNIPFITLRKFDDASITQIKNIHAEVGVLGYFGIILPTNVLNLFPKGILNIHPSLLPKYRGPTPVQSAVLNGDAETGVTIIKLDEQMDHGPILAQEKEKILSSDTSEILYDKLFKKGAALLQTLLPDYINGKHKLTEQNHESATYTKRQLTRQDGFIDLEKPPTPEQLDRMIRAYHPWPGVWTKWKMEDGKWKILKLLPERNLQVEGKKPVSLKDFYNGYPQLKKQIEELLI